MLTIETGNLLSGHYPVIAHQCYATKGTSGMGLARAVFNKYPDANAYTGIEHVLGSVSYEPEHPVINMYTQRYPGKSNATDDIDEMRLAWFKTALFNIGKLKGVTTVAFPYMIGCGLAGGYWLEYEDLIIRFADWTEQDIILVKLKES